MVDNLESIENSFIKTGTLFIKESGLLGKSRWIDNHVILHSSGIAWWRNIKEAKKSAYRKPKAAIALKPPGDTKITQIPDDNKPYSWSITTSKETFWFSATSIEEMKDWCYPISEILKGETISKETLRAQTQLDKQGSSLNLPPESIIFSETDIGSGASGVVRKGTWLKTTTVAVKMLKNLPEFTDQLELANFYQEVELLSKLRHLNIVQMYGYSNKSGYLCLVTEFVKDGSLSDRIKARVPIDNHKIVNIGMTISAGMVYLHSLGIIHRDLKPGNILIANWEEGSCKVCDFGLSGVKQVGEKTKENESHGGSPQYAAPELGNPSHTHKVDVFSFAVVLWEMTIGINGIKFFEDIRFGSQFSERYSKGQRPPTPNDHLFKNLLEKTWSTAPEQRLDFDEVFSELESIKSKLPPQISPISSPRNNNNNFSLNSSASSFKLGNSSGIPPITGSYSVDTSLVDQIYDCFDNQPIVSWSIFTKTMESVMSCSPLQIEKLKYLLGDTDFVKRQTFDQFVSWFNVLVVSENLYQTDDEPQVSGWTMDMILAICDNNWFHGWLPTQVAQSMLKGKQEGTFLFRFSTSSPGSYALSCSYNGTVGHWRISCEKGDFFIDGRKYSSLKEIIESHSNGKEGLIVKPAKGMSGGTVNLLFPRPR